jgi:membrane-associated phospholipid phosphatase
MIASRTKAPTDWPKGRRVCAALLLPLIVIAAPASAQELPGIQFTEVGDPAELMTSAALPAGARNPFVGNLAATRDIFGPPRARPSLPPIDWLAMAPADEASAIPPPGAPGLVFQPPADQPTHTGFKALIFETGSDFKAFPRRRSTWVILAIGGAAAAIAHPVDDEVNARLVGARAGHFFAPGKYIGASYTQVGAAAGLYVIGRYILPHADQEPKTNKVSHLGFDLLRSLIVSQALTQGFKLAVRRDRPTGECCAFPSGHASATFATASVLERHLGYRGAWPTFGIAAYVATSRLHDNRHFLSDVLFGGALGIASGWTVVGRHGRSNYALMPVPVRGGVMVSLTHKPSPQARRSVTFTHVP